MTDDTRWISTEEFAQVAQISRQAANRAVRQGLEGRPWREAPLQVRHTLGRGGRGGLLYEVALESLPDQLKLQAAPGLPAPIAQRATAAVQDGVILAKWGTIAEALDHPRGSAERAEALAIAAPEAGRSLRTLYRWVDQYEGHGVRGLVRGRAKNAGERRVLVSRTFDRALRAGGYGDDVHAEIATALEKALKGLWASRAEQAGTMEIRRLAEFILLELCEARGVRLPPEAHRLSRRGVERFALYRVVNQRRNDRKAFDDAKPRIRRDWTTVAPMERIVADVKHLDVIVTRPDGSPAWPKIVGFMDAGTGRIFVHPVLLDRGEGVRQEHVIEGFLAMVSDPLWGFPQGLYLDNGSEFGALTKIDSALQQINEPGVRTLIFARPYNASAKPIESLFARLDRYVFSMLPGYAGPNRLAKKTQTVGRPPKPYPGSWDDFCATLQALIAAHHNRPVGGQWRDRSPNDWLREKMDAGWSPAQIEPQALDAAFCDHDSRRVDRGVIKLGGKRYVHPALAALPSRTVVDLALPWRRGSAPLCRSPEGSWVYLQPEQLLPANWIEGAREAGRRQQTQTKYVSGLAKAAPLVDPVATKVRWGRRFDPIEPAPSVFKLDPGSEAMAIAQGRADAAATAATPSRAEQRLALDWAVTERLEAQQRRHD